MNRRTFIATGTALAFTPYLTGCNSTTVAEFVALIASDGAALATYFGATAIATQITTLAGQIAKDIANWQAGGAAADAIQAINDMIGLIGSIPYLQTYAPLIILLASALSGLLALLPQAQASIAATKVIQRLQVAPMRFGGFDKKSMTSAKNTVDAQWKSLTTTLPVTR